MSLIKQLIPKYRKFTPASAEQDWGHINDLVYGNWESKDTSDTNSAVFSCLMAIATAYPEPPLVVYKKRGDGERRTHVGSTDSLQKLLDSPTPEGELTMEDMLFWTAWAKHVDGNAYWVKVRSGNAETGNVVQLWPISPTLIKPISENGDWISYYKYQIASNQYVRVPVNNIIHFRLGVDDKDMRVGLAPLKALVRQISTDDEADKFVEALLKNYAVPGLVVIPDEGTSLSRDEADVIEEKLRRKYGNEQRGNIAVMSKKSTVQPFGFSPDDMDLQVLHRIPEERISAVLGVPAIVAGLGAGLDRATYANFKEAREMFTEQKLIPQWRMDERKLNISLLPDFTSNPNIFIEFDLNDVRSLQDDEDSKYKRLQIAVGKPWMTRNEAREDIGMDTVEGWNEEDIAKPEPVPEVLKPFVEGTPGEQAEEEPEEIQKDLRKWRTKAVKSLKDGKSAAVPFDSNTIPPSLLGSISGALEGAKTQIDINRIFHNAMNWKGYP
jgi:HK97 family phage portal protein